MSDYREADHPRNPSGAPGAGEWANKTAVGDDRDLTPIAPPAMLADDSPANARPSEWLGVPPDSPEPDPDDIVFMELYDNEHVSPYREYWGRYGDLRNDDSEYANYRRISLEDARELDRIRTSADLDVIREASQRRNVLVQEALWRNPNLSRADWDRCLDTLGEVDGPFFASPIPFINGRASLRNRERFVREHPEWLNETVFEETDGLTPAMQRDVVAAWRDGRATPTAITLIAFAQRSDLTEESKRAASAIAEQQGLDDGYSQWLYRELYGPAPRIVGA